ncbi:RNA polymerase-associated protein LEO1 [Nakaseomyces bracarensis]|uniref:RNA polymerase-associated protein LEO1 n=1 Tax=Nakaseomyces bracarensis TaxID=273131 RepID=A0ABR4NUC6_9SACH
MSELSSREGSEAVAGESQPSEPIISQTADNESSERITNETDGVGSGDEKEQEEPANDEDAGEMDDLFGDDDEEDEDEDVVQKGRGRGANGLSDGDEEDEEDEGGVMKRNRRGDYEMDDDEEAMEQEMYTRKFYGEDVNNYSDDDEPHTFKESNIELIRHIIPYKTRTNNNEHNEIFYAKVPAFLTIDPVPFDPQGFETKVKDRLNNFSSKEDQLGDRLIDENTVRWRYSRDAEQHVFKESNAQIVQWSDGSFSLKLGSEYTDIIVNDTDNTFLTVSHDQQELMQCYDGGEITKTMMFIPTSTNSKIHQKLSKAVTRRNARENLGPGSYIIKQDPEIEKRELEKIQSQVIRERRKRQQKENETRENSEGGFAETAEYSKRATSAPRGGRRDEYEDDGFMVDDDEEEDFIDDGDEEEEEEDDDDLDVERLKNAKRKQDAFEEEEEESDDDDTKRRKVAVINDEDDE